MPKNLASYLSALLAEGADCIGEVRIFPDFSLSHFEDASRDNLGVYSNPHDAIEIAKCDDSGKYRPLKTAPDLRHGWRLALSNINEVLLALDFLYPAAVGALAAMDAGLLQATSLRDTLDRQSGMYAVVRKITDDAAEQLIKEVCGGCLRHRLWRINANPSSPGAMSVLGELPIYCAEACNLFVAAGRKMVKGAAAKE